MNYIFFAWLASIVYGLEVVIGKLISKHTISNPWLFNFIWSLFVIILILPFAIFNNVGFPALTLNLFWTSLFYALTGIFYIISLNHLDVTAMGPLFNFRSVFSVILSVIMLGEVLTFWQIFFIGIIFIFGILASVEEKLKLKAFFQPAIMIMMIFLLCLSLLGVFTKLTIAEIGFWNTTLWSMVIAQFMFLLTLPLFWKDFRETKIHKYSGLFIMSITSAVAALAANRAFADSVGITSTIMALPFSMIFTIIISLLNSKIMENHQPKIYFIRFASAVIMLVAALQLSK